MENFVGTVDAKHGKFNFCHFDEYIGLSMREYGEYSEIEYSVIEKFINKDDFVFDIGSNIGCFSIPLAKKVGSKGKIFSFEPQKFIFDLLSKNILDNKINNIDAYDIAIGENNTSFCLEDFDYSQVGNFGGIGMSGRNNLKFAKIKSNKKKKVSFKTLNEFIDIEKCNFLKIDVELMELNVLKGAYHFLNKFRPIIWIENHTKFPNNLNNFFLKNNYKPFWATTMVYNPENHFLNANNYYENVMTANTLAIPKEKQSLIVLDGWLNEITDEQTRPLNTLTKIIK